MGDIFVQISVVRILAVRISVFHCIYLLLVYAVSKQRKPPTPPFSISFPLDVCAMLNTYNLFYGPFDDLIFTICVRDVINAYPDTCSKGDQNQKNDDGQNCQDYEKRKPEKKDRFQIAFKIAVRTGF